MKDYHFKRKFYIRHGVKEYWIVDHFKGKITIVAPNSTRIYSFSETVSSVFFTDVSIDFTELSRILESGG
ncbi:MAG: Uma2 family endonuclease [Clostridiales bacterium]|nr:Uma2 family endonuclease [Clostridiales bacterium]